MSDKFTLSDKMTYHFLRYIITLSSSLSDFNIRNTLGLAKYKVSLANIAFFSCVAALLFYSCAQFGTCTWGNILPSQIPFSWSVPRYLEFQLDFPQTEIQYCFKERPVCQCV